MKFTVRRKMFLALLSVVVVFVVAVNAIVQVLLNDVAERELLVELDNAVVAFNRFDEQRRELLFARAATVAQTSHLVATLAIPNVDLETVAVAGQLLDGMSDLDILLILNNAGELMADVNAIGETSKAFAASQDIRNVAAGDPWEGVQRYGNHIFEVAAVPVVSNFQLFGVVVAGKRIDDAEAIRTAAEISGAHAFWSHQNTTDLVVKDAGIKALNSEIEYPELDTALVFVRELDISASGVATVRRFVLGVSVFIVLLGMLLCYRIAGRISQPVVQLTEATKRFGDGNLDARLTPNSSDEIGALTEAFNTMADQIVAQEQRLVKSLDAAKAASRAKSEFLARMSHEIRTPMNGVLGMAELLLTSNITDQQREYALTILDSGDGLMTIINDILDFSKIEVGKLALNASQFDINAAVDETVALLSPQAESKGLQLEVGKYPESEMWVSGDKLRFKQILTNFVGNAVKFTRDGQITINVEKVEEEEEEDGHLKLRVAVSDTGVGIRREEMSKIFEHFTQADGSDSREFGGTGLGLAICKELAELMGGRIGASSTIDKGSTFWFEVSLERASKLDTALIQNSHGQSALLSESDLPLTLSARNVEPLSTSASILLAEDNLANQRVAATMLRKLGCEIDIAEDGKQAVEKMKSRKFDIILMDCQMPNMDGFAATGAIRDLESKQNVEARIPIIAVTANALPTDRERCLKAGMNDYVSKPFRLIDLKSTIERWLPKALSVSTPEVASDSSGSTFGIPELEELKLFGATSVDLNDIVTCYRDSSSASLDSMNDAFSAQDRESLRAFAHKLKGGSGQVGAHNVASICEDMQAKAPSADWDDLLAMLRKLGMEVAAANEELTKLYGSTG